MFSWMIYVPMAGLNYQIGSTKEKIVAFKKKKKLPGSSYKRLVKPIKNALK